MAIAAKLISIDNFTLELSVDDLILVEFTGEAVRDAFNNNECDGLPLWTVAAWVPIDPGRAAITLRQGTGLHPSGCTITGFVSVV